LEKEEKVIGLSKALMNTIPSILMKISNQLDELEKNNKQENNVAVLWDVENVNPGNDVSFIEGLKEHLNQFGRITIAQAFADWNRKNISQLAPLLSEHHFELIHIPASRKNSADMSLITYGIEIALQYPMIKNFVLITGDSDFRPLVKSLRRNGKKIMIICNVNTAKEDFLILADEFKDFRTLRPGGTTSIDEEENKTIESITLEKESKEKSIPEMVPFPSEALQEKRISAFNLLTEAINEMKQENIQPGIGLAKVRVLMLNPFFDEKLLGYSNWSNFINAAKEAGIIQISGVDQGLILDITPQVKEKTDQEKAFDMLLDVLKTHDEGNITKYHNQAFIAEELYKKPKFKKLKEKLGFKKFKDFIQAAEVRKLIETEVDGLTHSIRRIIKEK